MTDEIMLEVHAAKGAMDAMYGNHLAGLLGSR